MTLRLQILLSKQFRTPDVVAKVRVILESLGIVPSSSGVASISATVDERLTEAVFGSKPSADGVLPIPRVLKDYVESISVAPDHIYMGSSKAL